MPTRVFVTRTYRASTWYDIDTDDEEEARKLAKKQAREQYPDVREYAVDNHWHPDDPVGIEFIGYYSHGKQADMVEVAPGIFQDKWTFENKLGGNK